MTRHSNKGRQHNREYIISSTYLISAVGQLHVPAIPNIPDLNDFKGKLMHSAQWDDSVSLNKAKIAVIGTGASGVQLIPELAKLASQLTVFQRSPAWVLPRSNSAISRWKRLLYRYMASLRQRRRVELLHAQELVHEMVVDPSVSNVVGDLSLNLMSNQIPTNPNLCTKLTPSYPAGCKRVILSDDYFPTLNERHVRLETKPIERITDSGILVVDEKKAETFDIIIFATGFRTTEFLHNLNVIGLEGRSLQDIWRKGARAYLGMTVESLPNFAVLYGPNTNLSHISVILMIEAQARYISAMVDTVQATEALGQSIVVVPRATRVEEYNTEIKSRLQQTVFAHPGCNSWYKTQEGVVTNNWPGTAVEYQERLAVLDWDDYESRPFGATRKKGKECISDKADDGKIEVWDLGGWIYYVGIATLVAIGMSLSKHYTIGIAIT